MQVHSCSSRQLLLLLLVLLKAVLLLQALWHNVVEVLVQLQTCRRIDITQLAHTFLGYMHRVHAQQTYHGC